MPLLVGAGPVSVEAGADDIDDRAPTFDAWVDARGGALLRFAYLVVGDRDRAQDAVQDALAKACGRWSRIQRADDPEAYVRRMIVNADISAWRRFARRETPFAEIEPIGAAGAAPTTSQAHHADHADTVTGVDAMWRLCAELPRRQRAAVVLRFYEGLPDAQIAEILGCGESTVRSQIHRALSTLRSRLTDGDLHD